MNQKARKIADKLKAKKASPPIVHGDAWEGPEPPPPNKPKFGRRLSDVESVPTEWLWRGYLPLGKLCIIDGDPGCGKSFLTIAIGSVITTGGKFFDDWPAIQGGVILLNAEDTAEDTVRSRVAACGGDLNRFLHIEEVPHGRGGYRQLTFPSDVDILSQAVDEMQAKLIVIDPITNHLDEGINPISDTQVRKALGPLKKLAEIKKCTILMVRHLNKSEDKSPLNRGSGAPAFVGLSRIGMIVGVDPDDDTARIVAINKCNLCEASKSIRFRVVSLAKGIGYVQFLGLSDHTAKSVFAGAIEDLEDKSALANARGVLEEILAKGRLLAKEVEEQASGAGIKVATLRRAKDVLGVKVVREGFGPEGKWYWRLPDTDPPKEG